MKSILSLGKFRISKTYLLLVLFVFFNTAGLPHGLYYTTLLSPALYVYLIKHGHHYILSKFFLPIIVLSVIHFASNEIQPVDYAQTAALYFFIYLTIYYLKVLLQKEQDLNSVFASVIRINFVLTILALFVLYTDMANMLWMTKVISKGFTEMSRLKMFVYEPSYYSTLMAPFFVYAFVQYTAVASVQSAIRLLLIVIPLFLSFSLGVLTALTVASVVGMFYFSRRIFAKPIMLFLAFLFVIGFIVILNTDNLLTARFANVLSGDDSSGNHRVFESTLVGYYIAQSTDLWFGSGFGQTKYFAPVFFDQFHVNVELDRLTNSVANTLAASGIIGILIRFSVEFILFFRTRVHASLFRLILFIHMFIYQFTGSFLTNLAEYFIWMLAFSSFLDAKLRFDKLVVKRFVNGRRC